MRLSVQVQQAPDALLRVLTVLARRQCQVTSVDYLAGDRHRPGRLLIGVVAPPTHASSVPRWVENLVDVIAVQSLDAPRHEGVKATSGAAVLAIPPLGV